MAIGCDVVGVYFCCDLEEPGHGEGVLVFHAAAPAKVKVATEEALVAEIALSSREVAFLL